MFIDGRADVYERGGVFADYLHISDSTQVRFRVLRSYGIRSCLIERGDAARNPAFRVAGLEKGLRRQCGCALRAKRGIVTE